VGAGLRPFAVLNRPGKRGGVGLSLTLVFAPAYRLRRPLNFVVESLFLTRRLSAHGRVRVLQLLKSSPHSRKRLAAFGDRFGATSSEIRTAAFSLNPTLLLFELATALGQLKLVAHKSE
jgi:hypothetical protein